MYRQYENPRALEEQLKKAKENLAQAKAEGVDDDYLMSLAETVANLEERVNFAWQDEEYEEDSARYGY